MASHLLRQLVNRSGTRRATPPGTTDARYLGWAGVAVGGTVYECRRPTTVLPLGTGVPLPELNLRTYVTYDGKPGVYFFSLDADGIVGVVGARLFHHLPYYYANISLTEENGRIRDSRLVAVTLEQGRLRSKRRTDRVAVESMRNQERSLTSLRSGYRYYTEASDRSVRYADIQHESWPLYDADVEIVENTLFEANGFTTPDSDPVHLYSPGVETIASKSKRVTTPRFL